MVNAPDINSSLAGSRHLKKSATNIAFFLFLLLASLLLYP